MSGFFLAYFPTVLYYVLHTHREIFLKSYYINPKSVCIYHIPIDLERNRYPVRSKSIGKW